MSQHTPPWIDADLAGWSPGEERPLAELVRSWSDPDPALERIGSWSGSSLALALLARREFEARGEPALCLAIGECVRRGLATAARASVSARAPLSGLYSEGLVGSDLARRFARLADALLLSGRAPELCVLVLAPGRARLESAGELAGLSARAAHRALETRHGACAVLAIGPAGERGVPLANLAACSAGSSAAARPPHFVGRGGLGAVLGALGLKAIAVLAEPVPSGRDGELARALASSPRLAARAEGGTFELFERAAARGEHAAPAARAVADGARERRAETEGCRGCPTPCGWVFEGLAGLQGARFGATRALGLDLGLERFEDALALLARCDELGIDAKECGARLVDVPGAGAGLAAFAQRIGELADGTAAVGVVATAAKGQSVRPGRDRAALFGQCVSSRGADPMRTFPFLASDTSTRSRWRSLCAPLEMLGDDSDLGRQVWWHENLSAALDATGFCAFSAAGLLADGVCTLDELARWIAPRALLEGPGGPHPGWRLIAMGDALASLARDLGRRWGQSPGADRPQFARDALEVGGAWEAYRELRSLDREGFERAGAEAWRAPFERLAERGIPQPADALPRTPESGREPAAPGSVTLSATGPLARSIGSELSVELELPAALADVLRAAAQRGAEIESALFRSGRLLPAVFRSGELLETDARIRAGDRLELVVAISGG